MHRGHTDEILVWERLHWSDYLCECCLTTHCQHKYTTVLPSDVSYELRCTLVAMYCRFRTDVLLGLDGVRREPAAVRNAFKAEDDALSKFDSQSAFVLCGRCFSLKV